MGVPGLFAFLKRRYATIARFVVPKEDGTYDEPDSQGDALYIGASEAPRLNDTGVTRSRPSTRVWGEAWSWGAALGAPHT